MKKNFMLVLSGFSFLLLLSSCGANGNRTGRVYMPDMTYSNAQETYAPYGDVDGNKSSAMLPPEGTIPQGFTPFHHPNTDEGKAAASAMTSPYEQNEASLLAGEKLFSIYCTPCHGGSGAGDGQLSEVNPGLKPNPYWHADLIGLTDGSMYFTLQHGKGMMGSYASQMSQKERWEVIQYVNFLQDEQMKSTTESSSDNAEADAAALVDTIANVVIEDINPMDAPVIGEDMLNL